MQGAGLKSGKAGVRRLTGKGRDVLGLGSSSSRFGSGNGKAGLGSAEPLLAMPALSSPSRGDGDSPRALRDQPVHSKG